MIEFYLSPSKYDKWEYQQRENKPVYRIIERYSNKTHKMMIPKLEIIGGVEND